MIFNNTCRGSSSDRVDNTEEKALLAGLAVRMGQSAEPGGFEPRTIEPDYRTGLGNRPPGKRHLTVGNVRIQIEMGQSEAGTQAAEFLDQSPDAIGGPGLIPG